jgi:hypothetical protein
MYPPLWDLSEVELGEMFVLKEEVQSEKRARLVGFYCVGRSIGAVMRQEEEQGDCPCVDRVRVDWWAFAI